MTERQLRTECEVLSKLGLIIKKQLEWVSQKKVKNFIRNKDSLVNDAFAEEKKLLRKHFSVKKYI